MPTAEQVDKIIAAARAWVGTPYHHQGRLVGVGCDCIMLLCEVYHAAGLIPYVDPRPYSRDWHLHHSEERYLAGIMDHAERVDTPQPGDIALYRFGRTVSHAAIVIDWPTIIHAWHATGVVIDDGNNGALSGRIDSYWRVSA